MEDANIQRNSPSAPEMAFKWSGIEDTWGANVWSQTNPQLEVSVSRPLPSTEDQYICPWIDGISDSITEDFHQYFQDEASFPPAFQENDVLDTENEIMDRNVWA